MKTDDIEVEISRALRRERRTSLLSWGITLVFFGAGVAWIFYSYKQVQQLNSTRLQLEQTIKELRLEIDKQKTEKQRVDGLIQQRRGILTSFESITGKRKAALDLALELQESGYKHVDGGRRLEDGGFDMSGFIDYILSRKEIGVMKPVDVPNCNFACLKTYPGITRVNSRSQLKPGDLIFYRPDHNQTMMYVGGNIAIGMIWKGKIELREINSFPDPIYAKVAYPDGS